MFNLIYQTALFLLALIALPKLLWQWWMLGKYKESLRERLGISLPPSLPHAQVIWIHAVSVGETRAVIPLYETLRKHHPNAAFVISSTTETGHREAKRSMPDAAVHCFLPFDFSWIIRRFVQRLHPNILIFVESDFWYQLIDAVKKQGGKVLVVNGKVSERSCRRFCQVPFFTRRLFSQVDHFCVQSRLYLERFQKMGIPISKLTSTGNLKFDARLKTLTPEELLAWRTQLGITDQDRVLVIGSTHAPEEEQILAALELVWKEIPELKVLLVPRHPERFSSVGELLSARGDRWIAYSQREKRTGTERVVLMDTMGLLITCYQLAEVALVAGSFTEKVGGHNVFEPVLLGIPVLFGPHMHTQTDLASLVLQGKAGRQVSLEQLAPTLLTLLQDPRERSDLVARCHSLAKETAGSVQRTYDALTPFF